MADTSYNYQGYPLKLIDNGDSTYSFQAAVGALNATSDSVTALGGNVDAVFSTVTATQVASTDVSKYRWVSVHINTQGSSSTVNFQGSNDNTNWVAVSLISASATGASSGVTSTTSAAAIFHGPLSFKYFRLNVTGIASGTTAGVCSFFAIAPAVPMVSAMLPGGLLGSSDGLNNPTTDGIWSFGLRYNGSTFDRERGNVDTAALISASGATTTQTAADQTNYNGRGVRVVLDMTTVGTGSVTLTIQGKDVASGKYYTLLAGVAVTTNTTNVYEVGPGVPATANVSANAQLPRTWRVLVTANNANATTYTVGASVIV